MLPTMPSTVRDYYNWIWALVPYDFLAAFVLLLFYGVYKRYEERHEDEEQKSSTITLGLRKDR